MVQGDEPLINDTMIEQAIQPLLNNDDVKITNLLGTIADQSEFEDRNCTKVVHDVNYDAMFMSREPVQHR